MNYFTPLLVTFCLAMCLDICAQVDTITIGFGQHDNIGMTASSGNPTTTLDQSGFLPNENAASRFLTQAALGHNLAEINAVMNMGVEDWIEAQMAIPITDTLLTRIRAYNQTAKDSLNDQNRRGSTRMWHYAWWNYHMTNNDYLRQRVAFALSEILVISENSAFSNNPYALGDYYDVLLKNAFGNYRDLLRDVTYHASMGKYLTYINNPKTDTSANRYPDENYARELMQLFTIGLHEMNIDGSIQVDGSGVPIATYDNDDIAEFSKIFTGLTWSDRDNFFRRERRDTSYIHDLKMLNDYHEPGEKYLLNGFVVPNRMPVDGNADINDALDNLFAHDNVGPFIGHALIQRLVTSNPSPAYIQSVAETFNDNGNGIRGDMKAVVKAILLHPEALSCHSANDPTFGKLKEPFIRYFQIHKAFNASTPSGVYRNTMQNIRNRTGQRPLASPSVFNFFQPDYQPLGPVVDADLVAPEFQLKDSEKIKGWINGLYEFIVTGNVADEGDLFSGEVNAGYADEISTIDLTTELLYTDDDKVHILLDRLNLILAQGKLSESSLDEITAVVQAFPNSSANEKLRRARLAIYLVMSSPEYLIHR